MLRLILIALPALVVALAGGFFLYLRSSLPQTGGRLVLAGPEHPIRIARDADDVPVIIAQDGEDAAFGLGFVHAQERLFQMEVMRRTGAGRLAEIFGPEAVAIDRQMRVLALYRAAEAEIPFLSPATRRVLRAYAAGVNAAIAARCCARSSPARSPPPISPSSIPTTRRRRRRRWPACGRFIAAFPCAGFTPRCRRRWGRGMLRTAGSSTAVTASPAGRCSPTIRISASPHRACGFWRA